MLLIESSFHQFRNSLCVPIDTLGHDREFGSQGCQVVGLHDATLEQVT